MVGALIINMDNCKLSPFLFLYFIYLLHRISFSPLKEEDLIAKNILCNKKI